MTTQEIIKACAELDGWRRGTFKDLGYATDTVIWISPDGNGYEQLPHYTTSYDAIIPLIQKQEYAIRADIFESFACDTSWTEHALMMLGSTPLQLCEALLRATGKWKE